MSFHRFHIGAACVALVCCIDFAAARSQGQRPLSVSFTPSTLHPGDVARVDISGIEPGEQMTATLLGQDLLFHYNEREHQWHALVGIDLDTKPGVYELRLKHGGAAAATTSTVRIEPKQFRVRRLTVSSRRL